jgi:tetratricopeptide (TPR) repeat protein
MIMKFLLFTFIALFAFSFTAFAQEQNERDKGIEFYRQSEYEEAIEILQSHVKIEEKDRLAWLYLGASYVKLKKDDEAIKAFRMTNVIYKKNLPVYDKKLKIISKPQFTYNQRASGKIAIAVEYGADGKIGFAFPFRELSDELTKKVVSAAKTIKFEPAVKDGKAVTVISIIEYDFSY